jgi:hypothetical protein
VPLILLFICNLLHYVRPPVCHHRLVIGPVQLEGLQRVSHRHVWRDEPAYIDRVVWGAILNNLVLYQDFSQKKAGDKITHESVCHIMDANYYTVIWS